MASSAAFAAPEIYTIEPGHTYPSFEVSHRGISYWRGKFDKTSGKIWLDREKETGKLDITIDTSTANFGLPVMDKKARNEEWFDVEKYPTATYKSDSITFKKGKPVSVNGLLTLRGVTKPVKLDILEFTCMQNPMFKREVCGGDARAEFDRRDFGMNADVFNNNGTVRLQIQVEALKGDTLPPMPPMPGGPGGPADAHAPGAPAAPN
ncbi:YceI family protein [Hydrocarboniphaga sp.]|uniref:YceI family protein n=1 Tax=Hydrocarboniphaga sp. TaxID=2033016 RepID=UPI003D0C89D0